MRITLEDLTPLYIREYVENTIQPRYEQEKTGHDWNHILNVMYNMDQLIAETRDIPNISDGSVSIIKAYLAVVYHDISLTKGGERRTHEIDSANIFQNDEFIKDHLTEEDIQIVVDAIQLHRASAGYVEDRTLLGKLLFQADRCFLTSEPIDVFMRSRMFWQERYPRMSYVDISKKALQHVIEKNGEEGYAYDCIYFPKSVRLYKEKMLKFISEAKLILGVE